MNFNDLKVEVKRLTGRNDTKFDDRVEKAINRAIREWARVQPWEALKDVITVTHGCGREMALPSNVLRCQWVLDKTNSREVEAVLRQWDRDSAYSMAADTTGYADQWQSAGLRPVFTTTTSYLEIASSDASDVVALYVTGEALPPGGTAPLMYYETGETINLVGSTPVTSAIEFYTLESICKAGDTNGLVTIKSQGNLVGMIGPFESEAAYPWVKFIEIPAANTQFKVGVYKKPASLVNAYQAPPAAVDQDYLIWAAASDIFWQLKEGDRSVGAMRKARDIAKDRRGVELMFGDFDAQITPQETNDDV